ncbi:MAG: DUF362 domain-containing protein [Candidatus Hodarchaeota archaeon]
MPVVSVARDKNIAKAVVAALEKVDIPDLSGKTILLKPNVGRESEHSRGINTNPQVVEAVFHFLKKQHDAEFLIGDSPIISTNTTAAFEKAGYASLLEQDGLQFVDLDSLPPKTISIPGGKVLKEIRVTGYIDKIEFIISIPVLKMHMHTGASLSIKNLKGLIYKRDKVKLHHINEPEVVKQHDIPGKVVKELDIAIADYASVIMPDLSIIDASFAQEGMGPSSGNPVRLDTIIASIDPISADVITLAICQPDWALNNVPHLKFIAERISHPVLEDLDAITTIPSDISSFKRRIEPPPTTISIAYNNVRLIDVESCSACLSTIFTFLKENKEFIDENFTPENPLTLAIGKGLKDSDLYGPAFLFGNCTANRSEDGIFIKGCTPVQSTLLATIMEYLKERNGTE